MNPAEDLWVLKVARKYFSMEEVDLTGMVDMVDMVDNVNMVDSLDKVNMRKSIGYFKMLVDTSVRTRWT